MKSGEPLVLSAKGMSGTVWALTRPAAMKMQRAWERKERVRVLRERGRTLRVIPQTKQPSKKTVIEVRDLSHP